VLIAIDDLQWSDRPSLRFAAYLAARLEGAPVLVAATVRSTDPGTDAQLLAEIAADPLTAAVRPGPLGEASVGELIRGQLGDADPAFTEACLVATGGNPLLLRHVLAALEQDAVRPTAAGAAAVRAIGSRAVSRTVLLRLSRLREEAAAVARAVAVLGESSQLPAVAALTGLDEDAVARAAGDLARADILRPEPPLGFVHPLVRDAVYHDVPAGERELLHGRAADVLARAHAADEEVAAQLVHAPRRGDPRTVEVLRSAARQAVRRGGPENGMAYLSRALDEPPPELRAPLDFELGIAAAETNAPLAVEHLARAYHGLTDPAARATAAFALAQSQLFIGAAKEGGALARRAAAELGPELADVRQMIEGVELIAVFFGYDPGALDRLAHYREARAGGGLGAKMIAAASAFAWGAGGGPAAAVEALALEACAGGDLLASGNGLSWSAVMVALLLSASPRATEFYRATREEAYRRGSRFSVASSELFEGAYLLIAAGDLEQGGEAIGVALRMQDLWGSDPTGDSWARGLAGLHAVLTGDPVAARAVLAAAPPEDEESDGANLWRGAQAELLLAEGRAAEALEQAELMGSTARRVLHPDWKPWQSLKARALAQLDRREEALAAMHAELELARGVGGRRVIGRCVRQVGELEGDARRTCSRRSTCCPRPRAGSSSPARSARSAACCGARAARPRRASRSAVRSSWPRHAAARRSSRRSAPSSTPPARGRARPRSPESSRSPRASCGWRRWPPAGRRTARSPRRSTSRPRRSRSTSPAPTASSTSAHDESFPARCSSGGGARPRARRGRRAGRGGAPRRA
jgi:hypothetical protein